VDEGVDLRARLHGGREVQTEAKGIAGAFSHLGQSLHRSDTQARHAGRSYAFATERLHILGHAAIGVRERTLGIAGAALGISTAVFGLEHVVRSSVEAWGEQRRSLAQTASVLRSTGGAANVTAEGVERLSATQSRLTGIEDDQITQAQNMMLTFRQVRNETGRNNDIFNQSITAAEDMSAAFTSAGKSMTISDAALQLGKALNDPARGMSRLQRIGVVFTQGQIDQAKALQASGDRLGAQRIILRELTKEFGGSAAAVATPGAKLHATIHQLEETFGRGLQPAIDQVDNSLIHLADKAAPHLERFSNDLTRTFKRKDLSLDDKLTMVGHTAKMDLGPFAHHLEQGLKDAHLDRRLEATIEWAAPKIAAGFGHAALPAAKAFGNAWLHTDFLGKAFVTAILLRKIGLKRLAAAGRLAGLEFGTAFAEGAAPAEAATGAGAAGAGAAAGKGALLRFARSTVGKTALGVGLAHEVAVHVLHSHNADPLDILNPESAGQTPGQERAHLRAMHGRSVHNLAGYYGHHPEQLDRASLDALGRRTSYGPDIGGGHFHIYIDGKVVAHVLADRHGKVIAQGVAKAARDAQARKGR
jgi:hypothetical protein